MIDEKKIEDAAFESLKKDEDVLRHNIGNAYIEGFHAGINWFLDNLWNTDIYKIEINKPILVQMKGRGDFVVLKLRSKYEVNEYPCNTAFRWLYIEDLLKGGK